MRGWLNRIWRHLRDSRGLINTTDVIVAAGATVILASAVATVATGGADGAKYGKAQPDAASIATAMSKFFADTGKWPGQVEIVAGKGSATGARFLVAGTPNDPTAADSRFPDGTTGKFRHGANVTCGAGSGAGAAGQTFVEVNLALQASYLDINDFLVKKPAESAYPNWKGPYLAVDLRSDPWDKLWLINALPLFCAEPIVSSTAGSVAASSGTIGYAWILSGGANRTLQTSLTDPKLNPEADDAGVNLGKLIQKSQGGQNF